MSEAKPVEPICSESFRVKGILRSGDTEKGKLGMLFSNRMDWMTERGGAITVKKWQALFDDLIEWKNAEVNGER